MKRQKTVFSDVFHVWAQQTVEHGRNPSGNRSFLRGVAYSYAEPIARIVTVRGQRVALYRDYSFSVTTSKMQSETRGATRNLPGFHVAHIGDKSAWQSDYATTPLCTRRNPWGINHGANLKHYAGQIERAALAVGKSRKYGVERLATLRGIVADANRYAETFGLKTRFDVPDVGDIAEITARADAARARDIERDNARRAAQIEREKIARAEFADKLRAWLDGADIELPYVYRYGTNGADATDYCRVRGDVVETSRGASAPLSHVKRAWRLIGRLIERGETWQRNGHTIHVGHYQVDSVDSAGNVRAGCHTFNRAEMVRFGAILDATPEPTDAGETAPQTGDATPAV